MSIELVPLVTFFLRWTCDKCGQVGDYALAPAQREAEIQHNSRRISSRRGGIDRSPCEARQIDAAGLRAQEDASGEAGPDEGTPPGDGRDEPDVDGAPGVTAPLPPDPDDRGGLFEALFTQGRDLDPPGA